MAVQGSAVITAALDWTETLSSAAHWSLLALYVSQNKSREKERVKGE